MAATGADLTEEGSSVEAKIWSICRMTAGLGEAPEPRETADELGEAPEPREMVDEPRELGDRDLEAPEPRETADELGERDRERSMKFSSCCFSASTLDDRAPVLSRCSMASAHLRQLDGMLDDRLEVREAEG